MQEQVSMQRSVTLHHHSWCSTSSRFQCMHRGPVPASAVVRGGRTSVDRTVDEVVPLIPPGDAGSSGSLAPHMLSSILHIISHNLW